MQSCAAWRDLKQRCRVQRSKMIKRKVYDTLLSGMVTSRTKNPTTRTSATTQRQNMAERKLPCIQNPADDHIALWPWATEEGQHGASRPMHAQVCFLRKKSCVMKVRYSTRGRVCVFYFANIHLIAPSISSSKGQSSPYMRPPVILQYSNVNLWSRSYINTRLSSHRRSLEMMSWSLMWDRGHEMKYMSYRPI